VFVIILLLTGTLILNYVLTIIFLDRMEDMPS
jgi:phage shock protein PspC (stress-responsive transcriptional regulator)